MASIGMTVRHGLGVAELSAMSRGALDRPLLHDAELLVVVPSEEGILFGAHQRVTEVAAALRTLPLHRRGSGGGETRVGPGTIWLQLALSNSSALVPCPPDRLINRHVRPLLRAITKAGVLVHYFERDWVSGEKRPVAQISFAHDASTGRALVEALIAVTTPFAMRPRSSLMGKAQATLRELGMRSDAAALSEMIVASYAAAYGAPAPLPLPAHDLACAPALTIAPWPATRAEAIGLVGAGWSDGRLSIGGELMVSRDALARLEASITANASPDAVGARVDETLGAPGVALFGVRSLRSIRDVIVDALAAGQ